MTQDYTTEAAAVANAMNAVYENKQVNKKDSITGDYSSDSASYPTVKAVKNQFGNKVTSWSSTTSDSNYPSEKLVKTALDGKQATLVSGTTIKTINNESLLGSGNISITTGTVDLIEVVQSLGTASADTSFSAHHASRPQHQTGKASTAGTTGSSLSRHDNLAGSPPTRLHYRASTRTAQPCAAE